jgi:regulator of cell morphogenesis and NO signaling
MIAIWAKRIADVVAEQPDAIEVFERLGVDYCCGGDRTLDAACREKGLDVGSVVGQLQAGREKPLSSPAWRKLSLSELCDHIEWTHHALLRHELPRLRDLIIRVVDRHGKTHPELVELAQTFDELHEELVPHMVKEERVLFPMIRALETAQTVPRFACGSMENPIGVMEEEHRSAGQALERLRELTHGYQPPADACASYRALLEGLARLEADLHLHIHKENNDLFPRALARYQELAAFSSPNPGSRFGP